MAGDHGQRPPLPQHAAAVEPQNDVGHQRHVVGREALEDRRILLHGDVEVVHLADGLLGADDVEHGAVHAHLAERRRRLLVRKARVEADQQAQLLADPLEVRHVPEERDAPAPVRAARDEDPACSPLLHLHRQLVERGPLERAHPLEHPGLAVIALERALGARDGDGHEASRLLTGPLGGPVALEPRRIEVDLAERDRHRRSSCSESSRRTHASTSAAARRNPSDCRSHVQEAIRTSQPRP